MADHALWMTGGMDFCDVALGVTFHVLSNSGYKHVLNVVDSGHVEGMEIHFGGGEFNDSLFSVDVED